MDYEKKIEIPFGAFDSELIHQEINIPNGYTVDDIVGIVNGKYIKL